MVRTAAERWSAMTEKLIEQILAIRDTGKTNMFDIRTVQYLANEMGLYELVIFLEDEPAKYVKFIFTGDPESLEK